MREYSGTKLPLVSVLTRATTAGTGAPLFQAARRRRRRLYRALRQRRGPLGVDPVRWRPRSQYPLVVHLNGRGKGHHFGRRDLQSEALKQHMDAAANLFMMQWTKKSDQTYVKKSLALKNNQRRARSNGISVQTRHLAASLGTTSPALDNIRT